MRLRMSVGTITAIALLTILAGTGQANLLVNGGFEDGGYSPCTSPTLSWTAQARTFPPAACRYDGTTWVPDPGRWEGLHRGSLDLGHQGATDAHMYQVVTVVPGQPVHLTGKLYGGGFATFFARILDGAGIDAAPLKEFTTTQAQYWHSVDLTATPTGDKVTVEWGFVGPALPQWGYRAAHSDAWVLTQESGSCTAEPTVTSINKEFAVIGTTLTGLTVTGTNFDATCQVSLQAPGQPAIQATNVVLGGGGTTLTCDVPLTGAAMGVRSVVVAKANCNDASLNNAIYIVQPALTNGSFEDPTAAPSCPTPTEQGAPDHWLQDGVSTMTGSHLVRDSDLYIPSCPRPDADHYATIKVPTGISFADWNVYQYVAVTPAQQITLSGLFAGGGRTTVTLSILDGSETGPVLATRTISRRIGCPVVGYDWVFASVSAVPTKGFVTLRWSTHAEQNQDNVIDVVHASHADNLVLTQGPPAAEICDNAIDDDGDRRMDCLDSDCTGNPACPAERPPEICNDLIDNDGDLNIDCDDSDCDSVCVEVCNDGIDNDFDCRIDEDCTEICTNGQDDNNDGLIDCDDPECTASPACDEDCANGEDDNNNGLIDCYDAACKNFPACTCIDPATDVDDDDDVDMDDFAAWQRCHTAEAVFLQSCVCLDHDRDGDVDEADMLILINCASGPGITADPDCDN